MKLLFAADPHGSTTVLRKALSAAEQHKIDLLVVGGDLQGKFLVPIIERGAYIYWEDPVTGAERRGPLDSAGRVLDAIAAVGGYGLLTQDGAQDALADDTRLQAALNRLAISRLEQWIVELEDFSRRAGITVMLNPGNDDDPLCDAVIRASSRVLCCNGAVLSLDGVQLAGIPEVPPTPWNTHRELSEADMQRRLQGLLAQRVVGKPLILCAHSPPFASGLDTAPALTSDLGPVVLGGVAQASAVGCRALRRVLETAEGIPLALHGHIHESAGFVRIGRTLCLNPGSEYGRGILWYYIIGLSGGRVTFFDRSWA